MMHKNNISVLGAGSFGTSLAILLAKNGHNVCLWGHKAEHIEKLQSNRENTQYLPDISLPDNLIVSSDLAFACHHCDAILMVVPSHAFANTLQLIKPYLENSNKIKLLTWATKGLDPDRQVFLSDLIDNILDSKPPYAFITGPSFADELAQGKPTILTVASPCSSTSDQVKHWFQGSTVRTYVGDDIVSAQIGASVKNIMAIATGISDGLNLGANARSGLITRGLAEMIRFAQDITENEISEQQINEVLIGPAGLGDLILTATDNKSRNRKLGLMLGQGMELEDIKQQLGQVAEGVITTKTIYLIAQKREIYMPITSAVYALLYQGLSPLEAAKSLLERR